MKQRLSSLDVSCIVSELSTVLPSLRLTQIYDLSTRIFLIKFGKPGKRESIVIDAGFRAHLTSFTRTAASSPSVFVSKLRKYLRSRRVTGVRQLGKDRVVEIAFSDGLYRLYLEFFAAGNIILADKEGVVLCLWRVVSEGDVEVDVKVGGKYNVEGKQGSVEVTRETVMEVLERSVERVKAAEAGGAKKGKKLKGADDLKKVVANGFPEYSVQLVEHVFLKEGVDASLKPEDVLKDETALQKVYEAMLKAQEVAKSITQGREVKGYIIATTKQGSQQEPASEGTETSAPSRDSLLYEDFHPFRPAQLEDKSDTHILEFDGFNKTIDEFYSSLESQKLESRLTEREEKAKRKIEEVKSEHEKRVGALQQVQELHIRKAQAIEANTHRVEEAIAAVNGLIGQGMDWMDIGKLIESEQGRGNAVAEMVKLPLKLYENTVTLLLDEPGAEVDSEDEDEADVTDEDMSDSDDDVHNKAGTTKTQTQGRPQEKRLAIDIDLALSPWANARQYYDQKKTAAVKEQKTVAQSAQALQNAQRKIEADLKKGLKDEKAVLRPQRKAFWFEKFSYFISSDGYLVLGGKDAQQNELLYRRYLKKGDIYVHADLQGAASVVVKNMPSTPDAPIPPSTLSQAGALTVSTSSAWDSKAVMAAWWVEAGQVSKTAPTGEYLTTGGFMIRGKKNFLPPSQLLLGFGVLFLVSEDSRRNHVGKGRYADADGLERTESVAIEDEGRQLDGDMENLSVEETGKDGTVPDVEDASDEAEHEIEEDYEAEAGIEDDSDDDDGASIAGSEAEASRINPLQTNSQVPRSGTEDETEKDHEQEPDNDNDADNHDDDEADYDHEPPISTPATTTEPSTPTGRNTPDPSKPKQHTRLPRGKRAKLKKAAQKYANQDDEDRALAMELLGSTKAEQRKVAEQESKEAREAKNAADRERRKAQHEKAAVKEAARQARIAAGEEQEDEQDEETLAQERRELADLDLLVGMPSAGDEIVAAIPMVGPWGACGRLKYKVKIQPGGVKKGKAIKEIVGKWSELGKAGVRILDPEGKDKERVWPREVEAIKSWRVEEVVGTVPVGKVRVVWSGGLGGTTGGVGSGGPSRGGKAGRGGKGSKKR
jgi:predicted ribosome quality control (RQC) complex YloA/Tae2 family protein